MDIKKFIKDLLTEPDNQTYCLIKSITASGALIYFGCSISHVVINHSFDFVNFGIGLGSIAACAGGGLMMKKDTPIKDN